MEDAILDGNEDGLIAETIRCKTEKQGEQKPTVVPKFRIGDTITPKGKKEYYTITDIVDGWYEFKEKHVNGGIPIYHQFGWELVEQKPADKVEPKFKVGDTMRTLQEANDGYTDGMPVVVSIDDEYYHCTNELIAIKDQDDYEFPPINVKQKIEPKFHKGEWLCENEPNNYSRFIQILEIVNVQGKERYRISRDLHNDEDVVECRFIENNYHLWTIQDAKENDVLATLDYILVFKEFLKNDGGISYCHYDFGAGNPQFVWFEDKNWYFGKEAIIHPATKEQHDLLFQKMHEAGYEWDAEKKELKKIEQKIAEWSDEDEEYINDLIGVFDGQQHQAHSDEEIVNWLKNIKVQEGDTKIYL